MKKALILGAVAMSLAACNLPPSPNLVVGGPGTEKTFTVTLESPADAPGPLSPGVYAIHQDGMPIFTASQADRGQGLEGIAEDGDPGALATTTGYKVFNTPVGDAEPGPATPGKKYTFTFTAKPGDKLSFATMYVQSNDGFYAAGETGMDLFNGNVAITGDVTDQVQLWDAGTEVNQEPVTGADQAPRQSGPNVGTSESEVIQLISARADGFNYPNNIKVTIVAN